MVEAHNAVEDALKPLSWEERSEIEIAQLPEPGSLMDTHGIAYNRESYFR